MARSPFDTSVAPDWEEFMKCITREGEPARVHPIELFLDAEVKDAVCARFDLDADNETPRLTRAIGFQREDPEVSVRVEVGLREGDEAAFGRHVRWKVPFKDRWHQSFRIGEKECGVGIYMESVVSDVEFTSGGRLFRAGQSGLRLWNLDDETNTLLRPCADGRHRSSAAAWRIDTFSSRPPTRR